MLNFPSFFKTQVGGYEIGNSLRFRGGQYLRRTFGGVSTFPTQGTISFWAKLDGTSANTDYLFNVYAASSYFSVIQLQDANGAIRRFWATTVAPSSSSYTGYWALRDPSAWYHFCYHYRSNGNSELFINGVSDGVRSENNIAYYWGNQNNNSTATIGGRNDNAGSLFYNGYLAEFHSINGTIYDPTSFGKFNANGVWVPKKVTGLTYGTNGVYLDFSDPSNIGADRSGNGNNFTPTGFELTNTTSASYDWMSDTPTTNWCTFNPTYASQNNAGNQFSEGSLKYVSSGAAWRTQVPTFGSISSGKWYWEWSVDTADAYIGIIGEDVNTVTTGNTQSQSGTILYYSGDGNKRIDNVASSYGSAYNGGGSGWSPTVGVALDKDNNTITFYRNGTTQGTINLSSSSVDLVNKPVRPAFLVYDGTSYGNFGQFAFQYTPPTGYKTLSTDNLPAPDIADGSQYFNTVLYTGNTPTGQAITGVGFQPDFLWIKARSYAGSHALMDVLRGSNKQLVSNSTNSEGTNSSGNGVLSFDADGFTLGAESNALGSTNGSQTYVAWNWLAGGSGSSNTAGSITSTVSANPTAGFSIATYTGAGSAGTVGHGLGVAPKFLIVKNRSSATAYNWYVWHAGLTSASYFLQLNTTSGQINSPDPFNATAPTSTLFSVGGENVVNGVNYVAYAFSEVEGYSKFGSYTGNGSTDGPFVWCGFRPAVVLTKCSSNAGDDWRIWDNQRPGYNLTNLSLAPNTSAAEDTSPNNYAIDTLSNGFKLRSLTTGTNGSGRTYIFMALAENSFGGSGVSPATAR